MVEDRRKIDVLEALKAIRKAPVGVALFIVGVAFAQSQEPVVRGACDGRAVKAFGQTWVWDGSPELMDDVTFQIGNGAPREKIALLASKDIGFSYLGFCGTRMPRSQNFAELANESFCLIDGNPVTAWKSQWQMREEEEPVWIRIDFAKAERIGRIVLRKSPHHDCKRVGMLKGAVMQGRGVPSSMDVLVADDGVTWQTVFSGETHDTDDSETFEVTFPERSVKQIRILGRRLRLVQGTIWHFSLGEVEAYGSLDPAKNLALISRGTGVSVSSTQHNSGPLPMEYFALWPLHWDAGSKWIRIGYHDDPLNWHWVEREKGRFEVDSVADAAVSDLVRNGVNVLMVLEAGNRLHCGSQPKRRHTQFQEVCAEMPPPPLTEDELQAWDRYVIYMAQRFGDRVAAFEIWNEWNGQEYWGAPVTYEAYERLCARTIPLLRRYAPKSRVMLGSSHHFRFGFAELVKTPGEFAKMVADSVEHRIYRRFASEVDLIGLHPFYNTTRVPKIAHYDEDLDAFALWLRRDCGFKGEIQATEWAVGGGNYPTQDVPQELHNQWWYLKYGHDKTEIQRAKEVVAANVRHAGHGMVSQYCSLFQSFSPENLQLSMFRKAVRQDPVSSIQPGPEYYAVRNLGSVIADLRAAPFRASVEGLRKDVALRSYGFVNGDRRVAAVWYEDDRYDDGYRHETVTVRLPFAAKDVWFVDPMNGVRQRAVAEVVGEETVLRSVRIGDAPLFLSDTPGRVSDR